VVTFRELSWHLHSLRHQLQLRQPANQNHTGNKINSKKPVEVSRPGQAVEVECVCVCVNICMNDGALRAVKKLYIRLYAARDTKPPLSSPRALLCNLNVPESLGTILLTDASSLVPRLKGRQALPDTQATIIVAGRADICRIAMIRTSMQFTLSTVHFSHVSISVLTASPKATPSGGFILSG
jgi:hypothetical protein